MRRKGSDLSLGGRREIKERGLGDGWMFYTYLRYLQCKSRIINLGVKRMEYLISSSS